MRFQPPSHDDDKSHAHVSHARGDAVHPEQPTLSPEDRDSYEADFAAWRNLQVADLEGDYQEWRIERRRKFAEEFEKWRSERNARRSGNDASSND